MKLTKYVSKFVLTLPLAIFFLTFLACDKNIREQSPQPQSFQKDTSQQAVSNRTNDQLSTDSKPNTSIDEVSILDQYNLLNSLAYSADVLVVTNNSIATMKVNVDKNKARIEMSNTKETIVYIFNKDMKKEYTFTPNAIKAIVSDKGFGEILLLYVGGIKHEFLGKEVLDGKIYNKYKVLYLVKNEETEAMGDALLLTDKETNVPYKLTFARYPAYYEWKNVKVGLQKPELFMLPTKKGVFPTNDTKVPQKN